MIGKGSTVLCTINGKKGTVRDNETNPRTGSVSANKWVVDFTDGTSEIFLTSNLQEIKAK